MHCYNFVIFALFFGSNFQNLLKFIENFAHYEGDLSTKVVQISTTSKKIYNFFFIFISR